MSKSPTSIARAAKCLHSWFLECHGNPIEKQEAGEGLQMLFQRGIDHEKAMVDTLQEFYEPDWDGKNWAEGHEKTLELMKKGVKWIYQGLLRDKTMAGFPDLLERIETPSELGAHSYQPVDIKGHKKVTSKDKIQLQAYAELLIPVLGYRVETGGIWLNTAEIEKVDLIKKKPSFHKLLSTMDLIELGESVTTSLRCGECKTCAWHSHCQKEWDATRSVSLLPSVTGQSAMKYIRAGFSSWDDVAKTEPDVLVEKIKAKPDTVKKHWLHAKAREKRMPVAIKSCPFPTDVPIHFYDIETFGNITYLHGNIRLSGSEREVMQFMAKDISQEKDIWHQYLDYLAKDKNAIIYCWSDYEMGFRDSLWESYGGNTDGYKLLKNNLVDQCAFVQEYFALPTTSYSIKEVAPIFGFHWTAEDAGGLNSESWYRSWLETNDEKVLKKILQYNLDDVVAMEVIDRKLREIVYEKFE